MLKRRIKDDHFQEGFNAYLSSLSPDDSNTKNKTRVISQFWEFYQKEFQGTKITVEFVQSFFDSLTISESSKYTYQCYLQSLFSFLLENQYLNYLVKLSMEPIHRSSIAVVIPDDKLIAQLKNTVDPKKRVFALLLTTSGLQLKDLIDLRKKDFDFKKQVVRSNKGKKGFLFNAKYNEMIIDYIVPFDNNDYLFAPEVRGLDFLHFDRSKHISLASANLWVSKLIMNWELNGFELEGVEEINGKALQSCAIKKLKSLYTLEEIADRLQIKTIDYLRKL